MGWPIDPINSQRCVDVVSRSSPDILNGNDHHVEVIFELNIYLPGNHDGPPLRANVFSRCLCSSTGAQCEDERPGGESHRPNCDERVPPPFEPCSLHKRCWSYVRQRGGPMSLKPWLPLSRLGFEPRRAAGTTA